MQRLLLIETSSVNCSVALSENGQLMSFDNLVEANVHASMVTSIIQSQLSKLDWSMNSLDGIAIGKGPGSYTGLRIGTSTAKGICYALDLPLIACSSMASNARDAAEQCLGRQYLVLIDARRLEVYVALFDQEFNPISETKAMILSEGIFDHWIEQQPTVILGTGAAKSQAFCTKSSSAIFIEGSLPSARHLLPEAWSKSKIGEYENLAYFEPFYLKDFYLPK